jgi:uncharacterized protein YjgD (DUF1641 family)
MAEPIALKLPPRDPREALFRRLENAPHEHAEALLATYDILQGLHDRGLLELTKGVLGSSDKVLQILIDAVNTPKVVRGIRNLMILIETADEIGPNLLENLGRALPVALAEASKPKPLGMWQVLKMLSGQDSRRVLVATASIMQSLGRGLGPHKP